MPLELDFSTAQIVIIIAISFLAMLIGALFNQRKTRTKWEYVRSQLMDEMEQTKLELNSEILELKETINQKELTIDQYQDKLEFRLEQLGKSQAQAERVHELEQTLADSQRKQMELQLALSKSNAMQQTLAASFDAKEQALNDKIQLLEDSEVRLNAQFENLATKIFEARSEKLQSQNNQQLDSVLAPFKQQLEGFRAQVQASYSHEQTQRSALKHQLDSLTELNLKMSQDAVNLTKALKGDNKQQGNWGEVILERVLQESGLREGHEYDTQADLKSDNGKRFKPDVIVHLPENKDVVIDAKMSLIAYERYFNSDDDEVRAQAIKEHIISIRSHIKGLSQKDYQKLHGLKSLDYVLMFIPLEPAFLLALEHDPSLVNYALESNIMLVSPTNLLVALRTINNIWRYEYQNQNAQMIAKQAGKIYDKLCGYLDDMDKLGRALESADKNFTSAMNKLSTGKGNVIRQAHQMQQLGVQTSKKVDAQLLDKALSLSDDDIHQD
ncbi:DNA recombination protein RmuC [Shewanella fidelis]|uniref:DNA recombination protein RmuC n=1 Tax=Shewanella fidelis TaxID=173509 RepID=A0AAW8NMH1_9GAMM|nr:DNA recombination protein RmuC [Shewanella fidelis]MDR8524077.1 DNA recombination protein RmuC [Shewanella fidelis]MDW4810624.1 DNA recombination protein RmuC [Shewanella fidelis]MDW4814745.1 DNA recombination protein RmuC [Shewanella fidelis]MDW4818835.1 DNA recombination protein RmuC [Shewanella fidelis]MDW4823488.1 DNA recombination protein RmuC [Shewanella fidelis]